MTKRITIEEINQLYRKWQTPPHVKAHCKAVAETGVRLAKELNKKGYTLDLDLIRGSGMVHDVARIYEEHARLGYEILMDMGYPDEAEIVKVHMFYPTFNPVEELNECDIICLADRVVKEDKYVGLDERIEYIISKGPVTEEIKARIYKSKAITKSYIEEIETIMGKTFDELFREENSDEDEQQVR